MGWWSIAGVGLEFLSVGSCGWGAGVLCNQFDPVRMVRWVRVVSDSGIAGVPW